MPLPTHYQSSNHNLPRRIDSLKASKGPYFSEVDDELRDIKRVHAQGQEEDLRYALSRTISRMEEFTSMLKDAYKVQTDLQTELTLAKSNLQLALANNEMLEDALRRTPGNSKDLGWRRMSAREQNLKAEELSQRRRSSESLASTEPSVSPTLSHINSPIPDPSSSSAAAAVPRSATIPSPAPSSENRFFRFRFGNGSTQGASASHPSSPRLAGPSPMLNGAHLTSASLPSLVPPRDWDKEIEDLQHQLDAEKKAHKQAADAKVALEGELESLSQALFEEANKMVATERRKLAETEDALREAREQGEALKSVLRLFERDSAAAAANTQSPILEADERGAPAPSTTRSRHRASSSAVGIRVPSPDEPSLRSHPASPALAPIDLPSSAKTVTVALSSASSQEIGRSVNKPVEHADQETMMDASVDADTTVRGSITGDLLSSSSSSSDPLSSSPDPLSFASPRPVYYFDGEESPWADAASVVSPRPSI